MSESNGFVDRGAFRASLKRRYATPEIPGFGRVCIQSASNAEKEELQYSLLDEHGQVNYEAATKGQRVRLIIGFVVDPETKERWFTEDDFDHLQNNTDPDVIDALADEIIEHTGINRDGVESLKKRLAAEVGSG